MAGKSAATSNSIVEVAKAAGVSTATVSRVLNGLPGVRAETVTQVRAAVSALSYTPQRVHTKKRKAPRRPARLQTGNLAVITVGHGRGWLDAPVLSAVLGGIQRGTEVNDLRLLLGEMADPAKLNPLITGRQIDGAIVFISSDMAAPQIETTLRSIQKYVPVVWAMGMEMQAAGVDHITPDNVSIGHLAFKHLQKLGCRRFGFLTENPNWPLIRLRAQAFLNSAFDAGVDSVVYTVAESKKLAERYGPHVQIAPTLPDLIQLLGKSAGEQFGLFMATDATTSRVYPLLAQHGLQPGRDVRVVSCDNETVRLSGMHPRPASIDIGAEEVGFRAVHRLINRIDRPNGPPLVIQVAPRLFESGAAV